MNYTEVIKGFYHSDERKFSNTLSDLHMEGNEKLTPLWADLDFLDHGEFGDNDLIKVEDEEQAIRNQIAKLEQMKVDLDAEFSKSQDLLKLQQDIEKENRLFHEHEIKRLSLVESSVRAKAEELARRVDDKTSALYAISRQTRMHEKGHPDYRGDDLAGDDAETLTEFSKMTNESDIKKDENILDLKLMAADYALENFKQV